MTASEFEFDPIGQIADEFVARLRRGEDPSITEYTRRDPANADRIRAVMSALQVVEKLKPGAGPAAALSGGPSANLTRVEPITELIGDYRIVREIGRGGLGVVYEAEQQSLRRRVAVKLLPPYALADGKARERFRREANVAARLHHTNIVPVYEVGEADGALFYAMQFIDGRGLEQILEQRIQRRASRISTAGDSGPERATAFRQLSSEVVPASAHPEGTARERAASTAETTRNARGEGSSTIVEDDGWAYWRTVARIGIQVADALSYAHERHVLHRDIKPSNLLLDPAGTVWITDFGLAKPAAHEEGTSDSLTETGDILGTIRYLAPERLRGIGDARSDIYGLG